MKRSHPNQFKTSFSRITTVYTATGIKKFRFILIRLALYENIAMIVIFHSKVCVNFFTLLYFIFIFEALFFLVFCLVSRFPCFFDCVHDGLL